jgi:ATP-dependent protease HslVU (ClpYQ) peptidase subunit
MMILMTMAVAQLAKRARKISLIRRCNVYITVTDTPLMLIIMEKTKPEVLAPADSAVAIQSTRLALVEIVLPRLACLR